MRRQSCAPWSWRAARSARGEKTFVGAFEAAIADPKAKGGAIQLGFSNWILRAIPADQRLDVVDKLLPLLSEDNERQAAAEALAIIPLGDRANQVIDKLLSLLGRAEGSGAGASGNRRSHPVRCIGS